MKPMKRLSILWAIVATMAIFVSCSKSNSNFNAVGGALPTKYISILDSTYSPVLLTVSIGSSITFVNSSSIAHTIVSDDTVTIKTPTLLPGTSFYYKKDTLGTFNYHCKEHPNARGTIVFRP